MPDITVEIELYCSECGAGICNNGTERTRPSLWSKAAPGFDVTPCDKCMDNKHEEGYQKGYDEGYKVGYDKGLNDGEKEEGA
jgi:hypothetical protein